MALPSPGRLPVTYVLPLRAAAPQASLLGPYLEWLVDQVEEVIVVDGSGPAVFAEHESFPRRVVHVQPDADLVTPMGKVGGVVTGLRRAGYEAVVVADDDIRYDRAGLEAAVDLLGAGAGVVRPQNYFDPLPWHALWDTGRILINRVTGGDWPGTLALRRSFLPNGYAGDVLFENLEMVRTIVAAGGHHVWAPGLYVRRLPPTTSHFWSQRVRQAYDEMARPGRLSCQLALAPGLAYALWRGRHREAASTFPASVLGFLGAVIATAEAGRWRNGGRSRFPLRSTLMTPLWVVERAVTSWLAVLQRLRGGVPYGGIRLPRAAGRHPPARRVDPSSLPPLRAEAGH
jgi:hypothetical protein